jgi:hypothetical protein
MGVTYKLKDDIVQFILQQKQQNPKVSCRKLVDIIQESFQIAVSKSSVNIIIKEANLSNPVGRTPGNQAKFKIPQEKKSELFQKAKPTLEILGVDLALPAPSVPQEPLKGSTTPPLQLPAVKQEEKPVIAEEKVPEPIVDEAFEEPSQEEGKVLLRPDPLKNLAEAVPTPVVSEIQDEPFEEFPVSQTGKLFVRAAIWDLSRQPLLESFLKHNTDLSNEDIRILDVLFCFEDQVFDDPASALTAENAWVWRISGFFSVPTFERVQQLIQHLDRIQIDQFNLLLEVSFLFSFASEVRIVLRDESVIRLDARLLSFNNKLETPVNFSVDKISKLIAERDHETVIYCPEVAGSLKEFVSLAASCQGVAHKEIQRIVLYDSNGKSLSEFDDIAGFKRRFVLGARVTPGQFTELFNSSISFSKEKTILQGNETIYWNEATVNLKLSELENDKAQFKAMAFTRSLAPEEAAIMVLLKQEQVQNQSIIDKISNIVQLLDNKYLIEKDTKNISYLEEAFKRDLKSSILLIKGKIKEYSSNLCTNSHVTKEIFTSISSLEGYVRIGSKELIFEPKSMDAVLGPAAVLLGQALSALSISNYDGKQLKMNMKYNG